VPEQDLAAVPWERLSSADPRDPGVTLKDVRRMLRRPFRSGPASTEADCPLSSPYHATEALAAILRDEKLRAH
jgi:hypothetical protein